MVKGETDLLSSLLKKNVKEGELYNDLTGRYLSWRSFTDPLQDEQCRGIVYTVLHIKPGVQRLKALITNRKALAIF